jgi:hypothetical protein
MTPCLQFIDISRDATTPPQSAVNMATRRQWLTALPVLACPGLAWPLGKPSGQPLLTLHGRIRHANRDAEADFDAALLASLPQHRIRTSTPWHQGEHLFAGPLLREVLQAVGAEGQTLRMSALNDYRVDMPADEARRFDIIIASQLDGREMTVRDKGPLFVMYPFDRHPELRNSVNLSRCIWQLRRIEIR